MRFGAAVRPHLVLVGIYKRIPGLENTHHPCDPLLMARSQSDKLSYAIDNVLQIHKRK